MPHRCPCTIPGYLVLTSCSFVFSVFAESAPLPTSPKYWRGATQLHTSLFHDTCLVCSVVELSGARIID
ncbi:hypothetical protein K503DRAFT_773660 [Rhizopogon vinicolor AM-OR11-026]|uniref:Secreted protein n=1 Tax=Rhizopogon vinicolor AM-OR11-026 TaxID=1314800 RepID=A0A1B7MRQ8_9AGAM|nr:hypothetical protein K503DRAFT_773660 [Rhizopogon vinicolor AM-OR11-026]